MDIRSERLLVLKHNPCSDHVRAPLIPPMNIVRIKYSSVYREINISPHKNIDSVCVNLNIFFLIGCSGVIFRVVIY